MRLERERPELTRCKDLLIFNDFLRGLLFRGLLLRERRFDLTFSTFLALIGDLIGVEKALPRLST